MERVKTGTMLRALGATASARGRQIKELIDAGHLAPPPFVADLVIRELRRVLRRGKGVVFDGSPRTLHEAELLLAEFSRERAARVLVILLEVPKEVTVYRIMNRWVCEGCARPSHGTEESLEVCAACGGKLVRRADDTAEIARKRWKEYVFRTLPAIRYFERQGLVMRMDGTRPLPDMFAAIQQRVAEFFNLSH